MAAWLGDLRGSSVDLRVPQRGDKRALAETVTLNARQSLARHKLTRAGDLTARSVALRELQEALDLPEAPLRIECVDISHIQGSNVVGSMVVFEDGLARSSEYRRFIVRGGRSDEERAAGDARPVDDTAAMREVLTRRFERLLAARAGHAAGEGTADPDGMPPAPPGVDPDTGKARKFAYPPNLLVVDGGLPQVGVADRVLRELGVTGVAVVGLAKRLEEVWVPGQDFPLVLPRASEGLYLLQRVRDEAHRFAITFHRQRRSSAMTASVLDGIPGLGATRKAALLKQFGSVKRLRAATPAQLREVPGIGPALADTIAASLAADSARTPAGVNVTTGEILD